MRRRDRHHQRIGRRLRQTTKRRKTMAWLLLLLALLAVAACVALVPRGHPAYPHSPHFDAARQIFVNPQPLRGVTLFDGATGLLKML